MAVTVCGNLTVLSPPVVALMGGMIVLPDNMLFMGRVIDSSNQDPGVLAIRQLNEDIRRDERVDEVMLPISDGVTLVRRR